MPEPELALFALMSPAAFAPLDGVPGCCALARDEAFRVVWCNRAYAEMQGTSEALLMGRTLWDILPQRLADERAGLMRDVLRHGRLVAYQQVWLGHRWLTRVWPLDPEAFGHEGYFTVMTRLNEPIPTPLDGAGGVEFVESADLGELKILSKRELEVFYYLGAGLTVSDIAEAVHRSEKTIGRHVENIHRKMGYSNRAGLVRDAVQRGLVSYSGTEWLRLLDSPRN